MPKKQFFYKTDHGEYNSLGKIEELSFLEPDISNGNFMESLNATEGSFELPNKAIEQLERTLFCNNWRKRHHLPLIRKI